MRLYLGLGPDGFDWLRTRASDSAKTGVRFPAAPLDVWSGLNRASGQKNSLKKFANLALFFSFLCILVYISKTNRKGNKMTTFNIGQDVISTTEAQGLSKGATYQVSNITKKETAFGTYVLYTLTGPGSEELTIWNGTILLRAA